MNRLKLCGKLLFFCTILGALIAVIKKQIQPVKSDAMAKAVGKIDSTSGPSYYFIGSSRVQRSFNPAILSDCLNGVEINNWGMSSCTFFYNCIIADFLMDQRGNKALFIELSSISSDIPPSFLDLEKMAGFNTTDIIKNLSKGQSLTDRFSTYINFFDSKAFDMISIREEMSAAFKRLLNEEVLLSTHFGYLESDDNEVQETDSFLDYHEIHQEPFGDKEAITPHLLYIDYLLKKARQQGVNIYFFLPTTYNSNVEKHLVIPIFNALPETARIDYDSTFLNAIGKAEYLADKNHLNKKGAEVHSAEMCRLLKSGNDI